MLTKVHTIKVKVFSVVMYGCESRTIKKAECWRIDAFELLCWRRLLSVPWTARRSNQSILKEINPEYSLEELMQKLKVQCFGYLMRTANSFEKTLMLWKIEGRRRRRQRRIKWLDGITNSMDMNLAISGRWWGTGKPGVLQSMELQSSTWLSDWTTTDIQLQAYGRMEFNNNKRSLNIKQSVNQPKKLLNYNPAQLRARWSRDSRDFQCAPSLTFLCRQRGLFM